MDYEPCIMEKPSCFPSRGELAQKRARDSISLSLGARRLQPYGVSWMEMQVGDGRTGTRYDGGKEGKGAGKEEEEEEGQPRYLI